LADLKHVSGLDGALRNMRELPKHLSAKVLRKAVLAGSYAVRDQARQNAPTLTGRLQASIVTKFIPEASSKYQVTYYVVARSGKRFQSVSRRVRGLDVTTGKMASFKITGVDAYYWRFVEFGTANMDAQPFMRPAFESQKHRALGLITQYLKEGIDQSVRAHFNAGKGTRFYSGGSF
jgi:HK97 gp10 family phage protein